ncbi:DUF2798 domain-containing protein [Microbulbifer sp. SAOS-129_SWC]|uniref:DUF2798 domain-containing protein n=1 Tax=Microbulbifer sp. SAOS-129_SWC TaxID=3145235 RepID=UPI0032174439
MAALPTRFYTPVFALFMSCMMSLLMSALVTFMNTGIDAGFPQRWLHAFGAAWVVAFPLVSFIAPLAHRLTRLLVRSKVD